ncbi:hypothetical protein [Kribbella sp. CA-247076]|uniref:hypothetical protein n=1 Tax=Kribbella sp. CA-247076 TaxID=3239941 RepID=UPI003D8E65E3
MGLRTRGVSYTSGIHPVDEVRRIMRVIHHDLSCTSVMLIDTEVDSLMEVARIALDEGLDVVVRPHLPDARAGAVLEHLRAMALAAEKLRASYPSRVTLLVGTEFSLTARGIVPGPHQMVRLPLILRARPLLRRRITRRVNRLLTAAAAVAREHFHGPVGYGAAMWEDVDHTPFDFVGVNLYRAGTDTEGYRRRVRELVTSAGKPVVITEFGCGAQVGGDLRGPGSFLVVNWFADPPRIKDGHVRDEAVQASYLTDLIDLYAAEGVDGCFAFTFCMPDFPHRPDDPTHDLDLAGFGLVAVPPDDPSNWQPKQAFHALAQKYAALR